MEVIDVVVWVDDARGRGGEFGVCEILSRLLMLREQGFEVGWRGHVTGVHFDVYK